MEKQDYLSEFAGFAPLPFDPTQYGLEDISWHNDACPSFGISDDLTVRERLWCDWEAREDRQMSECARFSYELSSPGAAGCHVLLETESAEEMEAFLRARHEARRAGTNPNAGIVAGVVDFQWRDYLHPDVLALEVNSVVGEQCVRFLQALDAAINTAGGNIERETVQKMRNAAKEQCSVWLFG